MTRVTIGLLCVSALFLWAEEIALAQDNVSLEVTADFFSKYIWRGQNLVDDWVFQPAVSLGWGSSSYNRFYWGLNSSKLNDLLLSASFPVEMGG
jgi:hypothetical protein